ncbi:beta-eliminating lyase-related protein [Actinoplanes sp. NPDC051411]|uniref:threonine aldolase family protein n=1 Tax=Actinoplanes sp. NPDC051411 TaxID=3155522 RepID=UPI003424EA15
MTERGFFSDNQAGAHPEVLAAVQAANEGHVRSYGSDPWTQELQDVVRDRFGSEASAFPVFSGSAANVLALQSVVPPWGAVITAAGAHVHEDESTAAGAVGGFRTIAVETTDGRLTPELIAARDWGIGDVHRAQPSAISIAQCTEVGTTYTPEQIARLAGYAHANGMALHVDGARLANAAAHLGVPLAAITTDAGVDVVSLGGTKNGLLYGEAVVVTNAGREAAARALPFLRMRGLQLASKMRFISAQLVALYGGDLWLRLAGHANAMARRLADQVGGPDGVEITHDVESNGVFASLDRKVADRLRSRYRFADWDIARSEVRWMCAFDTTEADVDAFAAALREELKQGAGDPAHTAVAPEEGDK